MADNVKWIKIKVGLFDGTSFKRIKKAKIGGESFRDKLTAVWFELLDLGAKCNNDGFLYSDEIPYGSEEDIAIMIDRETDEVKLCLEFYKANGMIEIINDLYCLSNWSKYQNVDGLDKIREQTRLRVARHRENKKLLEQNKNDIVTDCNVTSNDVHLISNSNSINNINNNLDNNTNNKKKKFVKPTLEEVKAYCDERKNEIDPEYFIAFYESNGWKVGKNPMKNWKMAITTWEKRNKQNAEPKEIIKSKYQTGGFETL